MQVLQLPENYRCPPDVVNIANKMIGHNKNRFPTKSPGISISEQSEKKVIILKAFNSIEEEILWIINDIKQKGRNPGNTKILGRNHKLLNETKSIFIANGINAVIHQRKNEFTSFPMRFLHSLLRLFSTRGDKVYLQRLLSSFYQIEGINIDYHDIIGQSSFSGNDLLKAWVEKALVSDKVSESTKEYISLIINEDYFKNFEKLINISFEWLDLFEATNDNSQDDFNNYLLEKKVFNTLRTDIDSLNSSEIPLSVFLQELDLRDKSEKVPENSFELITIHGSKGLEFQNVYLIGMVNDILPSYNSIKPTSKPELLEEERRSCYVAITRTQQSLTITYSSMYWNWPKEPSIFLTEMDLIPTQ
jgi:DNA helicase-2/ATP-dependent DNA helicase PcrA